MRVEEQLEIELEIYNELIEAKRETDRILAMKRNRGTKRLYKVLFTEKQIKYLIKIVDEL